MMTTNTALAIFLISAQVVLTLFSACLPPKSSSTLKESKAWNLFTITSTKSPVASTTGHMNQAIGELPVFMAHESSSWVVAGGLVLVASPLLSTERGWPRSCNQQLSALGTLPLVLSEP